MPLFIAALLGGLLNIAGTLAGRVLVGLGISAITYTGLSTTLTWLQTESITALSGLPSTILGMIALMKVGQCISMIFSAVAVRMVLDGLTAGGSVTRWVKA